MNPSPQSIQQNDRLPPMVSPSSRSSYFLFALAIISSIGAFAVGAAGIAAYFQVGALGNLAQVHAIILMAGGGGAGTLFLVLSLFVKYKQAKRAAIENPNENPAADKTTNLPQPITPTKAISNLPKNNGEYIYPTPKSYRRNSRVHVVTLRHCCNFLENAPKNAASSVQSIDDALSKTSTDTNLKPPFEILGEFPGLIPISEGYKVGTDNAKHPNEKADECRPVSDAIIDLKDPQVDGAIIYLSWYCIAVRKMPELKAEIFVFQHTNAIPYVYTCDWEEARKVLELQISPYSSRSSGVLFIPLQINRTSQLS